MAQRTNSPLGSLSSDLPASLVVFLVALPLCLGIALGSGAPLFSGLIAGIAGGIVIGIMSGSQLSVSGPAAGLTTIVAAALLKLPSFDSFLLAVVLAGVFQLVFGFLKFGVLGDYVPGAVIKAMLAAIGIILILKQLPHFVGFNADYEGDQNFLQPNGANTFSGVWESLNHLVPAAALIGLISLGIQVLWDKVLVKKGRFFQLVPAPLVVVLGAIVFNQWLLSLGSGMPPHALVSIPVASSADEFRSFFILPDFSAITNYEVWITAATIAIVASLETLLNIEAADELDPYQRVTPTNRELKAQGAGNLVSGLLGGLPVTSVIVRTSANVNAGAKTKLSAIFHGLLLLLCIAFIPRLLNLIPLPALAAVLIYTGYKLAKPAIFKELYQKGWDQFIPFVVTIVAILLTDLLKGICIGCLVGLFFVLRSNFRSAVFIVNDQHQYLFRLRKDVSFLNKPIVKAKLEEVPAHSTVLIDTTRADFLDRDVVEVIEDFMKHAPLKNIRVELKQSPFNDHGLRMSMTA